MPPTRPRPGRIAPALLSGLLPLAAAPAAPGAQSATPAGHTVCIRNACFSVEIAVSEEERERGLMFRDSLPKDAGMLFVFPAVGRHPFWMKNTLIPLDIIWIGADLRVVAMRKSAPPCRAEPCEEFWPDRHAAYVLEINAGLADAYGLGAGDQVQLR